MRVLPRIYKGYLMVPLIWVCLYPIYIVTGVIMFANIPELNITMACAIGIAVLTSLVITWSAFVENKKHSKDDDKFAQEFNFIYGLFAVIGGAVSGVLGVTATSLYLVPYFNMVQSEPIIVLACAVSVLLLFVIDKHVLRNAADGLFYSQVECKSVDTAVDAAKEMSQDDKIALLREILR